MNKKLLFLIICIATALTQISLNAQNEIKCKSISAGSTSAYIIDENNRLWGWGSNASGQLGIGNSRENILIPQIISQDKWKAVSAGANFIIGVKEDGTLWGWGENREGQLGNGQMGDPIDIPIQISSETDWKYITVGMGNIFAIKEDGTLWVCGKNVFGELGLGEGSAQFITTLTKAGTDKWEMISAGNMHTLGLKQDGTIWACGLNDSGQLGIGSNTSCNTMTQIGTSNDWKAIKAGGMHSMGIRKDGTLWVWGDNGLGQLGDTTFGTKNNKNAPIQIGEDSDWKSLSATTEYSMAIKTDGTLWSWGANSEYVALGYPLDKENPYMLEPHKVNDDSDWKEVSHWFYFSLALKENQSVWAWGMNNFGQLATSNIEKRWNPEKITINDPSSSIKKLANNINMAVYPNPFTHILNIESENQISEIRLLNLQGKLIDQIRMNTNNYTLNLEHLSDGMYIIETQTETQTIITKVIKK